jgi:hypothetical protein
MRKVSASEVVFKFASKEFDLRYAKMLLAMTLEQAKTVLGFPPGAMPSPEEIAKAYKMKALENHPDRGGDLKKMVDVNVAKDVLVGKQRPSYESPSSGYSPPPKDRGPSEEMKKAILNFAAKALRQLQGWFPDITFSTDGETFVPGYSKDGIGTYLRGEAQNDITLRVFFSLVPVSMHWSETTYSMRARVEVRSPTYQSDSQTINLLDNAPTVEGAGEASASKLRGLLKDQMRLVSIPVLKLEGPSFSDALSDAGTFSESEVEWKFVSNSIYSWVDASSRYSAPGYDTWLMYGTLGEKHVFLALKKRLSQGDKEVPTHLSPRTIVKEGWECRASVVSGNQKLSKIAAKELRALVQSNWQEPVDTKPFTRMLFVLWPEEDRLTETTLKSNSKTKGSSLNSVLPTFETDSRGDSKTTVEVLRKPNKFGIDKFGYDYFLRINGKVAQLSEETLKTYKTQSFWYAEIASKFKGDVVNISRLGQGARARFAITALYALGKLQEGLTTEPSWVHIGLEKAIEEIEESSPQAKMASVGLMEAALHFGLHPYEVLFG